MLEPIAYTFTVDGLRLPVYEDSRGQFIIDENGEEIRGLWYIPREECDRPVIVEHNNP
jgi:hypothetical protein